jgi:hypothetical protein
VVDFAAQNQLLRVDSDTLTDVSGKQFIIAGNDLHGYAVAP